MLVTIILSVFGLAFVVVLGIVFLVALKIVKGGRDRDLQALTEDEVRKVQEIHQSLERMEKRVESLETLLEDAQTKNREGGNS